MKHLFRLLQPYILNLKLGLLYWFYKTEVVPKRTTVMSPIEKTIQRLKELNVNAMPQVFSPDMVIVGINSLFTSIEQYNFTLKTAINCYQLDVIISPLLFKTPIQNIYIRDFYIDNKNTYVDPIQTTEEFVKLAVEFLTIYKDTEKNPDRSFPAIKNGFTVECMVNNLHILAEEYHGLRQQNTLI